MPKLGNRGLRLSSVVLLGLAGTILATGGAWALSGGQNLVGFGRAADKAGLATADEPDTARSGQTQEAAGSARGGEASRNELDYGQHLQDLQRRLPDETFHIVVEKPFVVIGDEAEEVVQRRAVNTVRWAVSRLKKQYFARDPERILEIWLFKDKDSYNRNAVKLWGRKPHTIYGYYSPHDGALVMNISTGGGTLVHEIVHPFIEANFAQCPSWFNEGLASLYEQSSSEDGRIQGLTNWRLRGLQNAIEQRQLPTFTELMSTTRREFYDDSRGVHYAQARYLCYYLQEQGKLNDFYHQFVDNVEEDPTGIATLRKILGRDDLEAFQTDWEAFVMRLRF